MNRTKLVKYLAEYGCRIHGGGSHDTVEKDGRTSTLPRHRDISPGVVDSICKKFDIPKPRGNNHMKTVILLYDQAALTGDAAAQDVVAQLEAIEEALGGEYDLVRLGAGLDLGAFRRKLVELRPAAIFNLAESLDGADRLQTVIPLVLEEWGYAFTGNGSHAMLLSNHKVAAKRLLADKGLPTAACAWIEAGELRHFPGDLETAMAERWIVKAVEAHASVHLDDNAVFVPGNVAELQRRLRHAAGEWGLAVFAERYIEGREFNLSVWQGTDGKPETLPVAEIEFVGFSAGRPRIVGYAAKWEEDSAEYQGTRRRFAGDEDAALAGKLEDLAKRCWDAMGLAGYARVDFRVDTDGNPWILEVNTNPCLSPDAGFAAAAGRAGVSFHDMVTRILAVTAARGEGL